MRRRIAINLAGVVLAIVLAGSADGAFRVDPVCALSCRESTCGPEDAQEVFDACGDQCTATQNRCPALAHCFVKCAQQRNLVAAQCRRLRSRCIRRSCRIRIGKVSPAPAVAFGCEAACRAKLACEKARRRAHVHCRANCVDGCGKYPFPEALEACRVHCDERYNPEDCEEVQEECVIFCEAKP